MGGCFSSRTPLWLWFHDEAEGEPKTRTGHSAIIAAFLATFLLELGDTTMIFQIVFVTTYGWLVVLVGGASALVTVAAFASFLGGQFGARLSPRVLKEVVVGVLLVVGVVTILYGIAPGYFAWVG